MEVSYVLGKLLQLIQIPQIHNSEIDKTAKVRFRSIVVGSKVGRYSYISENTSVLYCTIGAFSSIASDCFIGGAAHPTEWVSTSPMFQSCSSVIKRKIANIPYNPYAKTTIGSDVWIGTHTLIKAGISIGNGSVIGMGSVVVKDIGDYEIWAGNPAKFIRKRFDDETLSKLIESKWWDLDEDILKSFGNKFQNPAEFLKEVSK